MPIEPSTLASLASYAVAIVGGVAAAYERSKSNKSALIAAAAEKDKAVQEAIIEGNKELVAIERARSEAWIKRHDELKAEMVDYRNAVHAKANTDNNLVMSLTKENSDLRAKTDVTPILEWQRGQNDFNTSIIQSLKEINAKVVQTLDEIIKNLRKDRSTDELAFRQNDIKPN